MGAGRLLTVLAALIAIVSVIVLERADRGLVTSQLTIGQTPATLTMPRGAEDAPLAVVAHGFAGSRQMMRPLQITLARSGMAVLTFDFIGHGRHPDALSPDVTDPAGTTADLVAQTREVVTAERGLAPGDPLLAGHSMATDVIVRAAEGEPVAGIVAISMYSDSVTATFPERLLILSGQWEGGLREVALRFAQLVDPDAVEGETVRAGGVVRRAAVAPFVGHVGILWSPAMLREAQGWAVEAGLATPAPIARTGPWVLALLASLLWLGVAAGRALPTGDPTTRPRRAVTAIVAPVLPALGAGWLVTVPVLGLGGFSGLMAFVAVWGGVQLSLLGIRPKLPGLPTLVFLAAAVVFALALDRYGAAFLPTGPRVPLAAFLALAAIPFALADARLAQAGRWTSIAGRTVFLVALGVLMAAAPERMGLLFTVLPVTLLYWLVFGTLARPARERDGAFGTGLAMAAIWGYAMAASTPLFAA